MTTWLAIPTDGTRCTMAIALASILSQTIRPNGVLIVENGIQFSTEQELVIQQIKLLRVHGVKVQVHFLVLPPEGLTRLRHEILLCCQQLGATHVLLMDDDAMLEPTALPRLLSLTRDYPNFGWASPVLLYPESFEKSWETKLDPSWRSILTPFSASDSNEVLVNVCPMAATTCLLIDLQRALALGGFDFFAYLPDFAEDRYFTARFFDRYDTFVHRRAVCFVTSGMKNEGKRWRIPVNKLLLRPELRNQLSPNLVQFLIDDEPKSEVKGCGSIEGQLRPNPH